MSFNGFGRSSGPRGPPTSSPPFGAPLSVSPPANTTAAIQQPLRPRPPPMEASPQPKSLGTQADMLFENGTIAYSERSRSPPWAFESNKFLQNLSSSNKEAQSPDMLPLRLVTQRSSLANVDNSPPHQMFRSVDYSDIYDTRTALPSKPAYFNAPQRVRSPPLPSANVSFSTSSVHLDPERPDVSPHRFYGQKKSPVNIATSPPQQRFDPVDYSEIYDASTLSPPKTTYFNASKRSRSPPLTPASISPGTSSVQNDPEREMNAKAKRLARFNVELSQPMGSLHDITRHKSSAAKYNQVQSEKKAADVAAEEPRDLVPGGILLDYEGLESSEVVVGICPDMCPESERDERERKGDLDKYERLDGERNQTSKFLAVKKEA